MLRHAFTGQSTCDAMTTYKRELTQRHEREAQTLANLTGWAIADIRKKMGGSAPRRPPRTTRPGGGGSGNSSPPRGVAGGMMVASSRAR